MNTSLDDVAAYLPQMKLSKPKRASYKMYQQKMQSLYGSRQFILTTDSNGKGGFTITLKENISMTYTFKVIGNRTVKNDELAITKAIKSLERKAKCKLYYVLLISTNGDYL